MNEQGLAWTVTGSTHDPSPDERRQRALRRELALSRPPRATIRERLTTALASQSGPSTSTAAAGLSTSSVAITRPHCCAA